MKKESRKSCFFGSKLWEFLYKSSALNPVDCFQLFISLLYLRRMDCLLKPYYSTVRNAFAHSFIDDDAAIDMTDGLTYYNVSGTSIEDILSYDNDIIFLFDKWINGFDTKTREVLVGLSFEKNIASIKKEQHLHSLIQLLCTIDLRAELPVECIRSFFSFTNVPYFGQFVSPESFGKCISAFLFRDIDPKDEISIYDPVCGSTLMLQEVEMEAENNQAAENIECYGSELNHSVYSLSIALGVLSGKSYYHIKCVNSLRDAFDGKHFDYIIADLPMGTKISSEEAQEMEMINSFKEGVASKSVPETYFMQMIMNRLKWDGRAAVITPERLLFDAQSDIFRSWLLNKDYVEAIVRLPKDREYTSVERYAWILAKEKSEKLRDQIRLVDMQSMVDSEQVIFPKIDVLFDRSANNIDIEKYFHVCWLRDISRYNIHLLNKKTGKCVETTIPIDDVDMFELVRQGFVTTDMGGDWEVLFEKTTKSYSIPFKKYFEENTLLFKKSNEIHTEIVSGLSDAVSAISTIVDLDMPNRKKLDNPMISSWAGEVPSDWRPISIQELFDCSSAYREDKPVDGGEFPILNVRYLRGEDNKVDFTVPNKKSVIVEEDDLIIIKSGANAGEVLKAKKGVLGNTLFRMRFNSQSSYFVNLHFAKYVLMAMSQHFKSLNSSISIGFVKLKDINSTVVYIPSLEEQQRIVDFLLPVCEHIEGIQSSLGVVIPKIKEFQDTLIFDAVTGKLNI